MSVAPRVRRCSSSCGDGSTRRAFLKAAGLGTASLAFGLPVMADSESADLTKTGPFDKKLRPEWIRSLFARGDRTVYRGDDLRKIGMPIGGICTGQVYLGGDGTLWHWDVFNQHIRTHFEHYANPMLPTPAFQQGFAIRTRSGGKTSLRPLDPSGFSDISFMGEYPIGYVNYRDTNVPVAVSLEAFAPFLPLNPEDSHVPATILHYTVKNTSATDVECDVAGWLQNAVCLHSGEFLGDTRTNAVVCQNGVTRLDCTASPSTSPQQTDRPPIELADRARGADGPKGKLNELPDFGSMSLALLDAKAEDRASASVEQCAIPNSVFVEGVANAASSASKAMPHSMTGSLVRTFSLKPGEQGTVTFVVAWHFPTIRHLGLPNIEGRRYGKRFLSAAAVVDHVAANIDAISWQTRLWHDTWYDSTLPYWFLDRTFANTSTLATSTAYWFGNGRFWGWEGVGFCEGTCTHVWQYAQAPARIFPSLERGLREMVDFGIAFHPDTGLVDFRAEFSKGPAIDGQAGVVLRSYREHQMSADNAFLKRNWPKIKKAIEFLINQDTNRDGILDRSQANTQDCEWFGKVAWLSSLYVAALRAGEQMALEMDDADFARQVRSLADLGTQNIDRELFNGEYYVQIGDKDHPKAVGSYDGCEIDQVFGQSWAFQVGLDRVLPREHTISALRSIWKYNYAPDIGPYRKANPEGRWFAMPGEGGIFLCTWPRGDAKRVKATFDSYFNEVETGFEWQVAGHMIREGLVLEGLAVARTIHDRYRASRRNPWNEIEAGDHYARAMASYGAFLAACGWEYHGPKGYLAFSPRMTPEAFRAAFTAAEGWGTISQEREGTRQRNTITVKSGKLALNALAFDLPEDAALQKATVSLRGQAVPARATQKGRRVSIVLGTPVVVRQDEEIGIELVS